MPVYAPSITVYLRGTEECLGVFGDEMEAAAWLAFEKLSADRVEMVRDASPLAAMAASVPPPGKTDVPDKVSGRSISCGGCVILVAPRCGKVY